MSVTVPSVQCTFSQDHNFYSRQEGQIDYTNAAKQVTSEGEMALSRIDDIAEKVSDEKLNAARQKLLDALTLAEDDSDPEKCKKGMDNILEAKRLIGKVRKDHLKEIRSIELKGPADFFNTEVREYARPAEITSFENLYKPQQSTGAELPTLKSS